MKKQLYRIPGDGVLGGVCAGIARYLDADVTVVRLLWVVLTLMWGAGIVLYILAWLIMPIAPKVVVAPNKNRPRKP
ncbi:MAG: PspC domain-containing protein [Nanoarchaeota archaeon]|nr:PspC domain-containing protein [Nanoarchaeota archaeon]